MVYCNYNGYFEDRTVLVTGGAGFIGSHLTQHLAALNCRVRVLDDFSSGNKTNLEGIDASVIEGSILDIHALSHAIGECCIVFHLGAQVSVPQSFVEPEKCFEINVQGTANVIEQAAQKGCSRVVFASSAACYGVNPSIPSSETDDVHAESPYARSKLDGERLVASAVGVDGVSLRYFNVFGPRQNPNSQYAAVVTAFSKAIRQGTAPTIFGDGKQTRDFTHVDNIVHANLLAASHPKELCGSVYNVGTGKQMSLLDLLSIMSQNREPEAVFLDTRKGDVLHSCADISAISGAIGYKPVANTIDKLVELVNPKQR